MSPSSIDVVDLAREAATSAAYDNHPIAALNDHVVRISIMTEPFAWHRHPNSDETFLAIEGGLFIDFDDGSVQVMPGQLLTVPRGVRHRTRPVGARSVNLTFERAEAGADFLDAPSGRR
jgi:mannose-6-phosphate isomerase-like protein (cupin superfamily)